MSEKNGKVFEVSAYPTSKATEIMDAFNEMDENCQYIYDTMRLYLRKICFCIGERVYDIEFIIDRDAMPGSVEKMYNNGIIFSDLISGKMENFSDFINGCFLTEKEMLNRVELEKDYYFDKPLLLRAQLSYQRGKGSTCGGTLNYGQTNSYAIKGIQIRSSFNILMSGKKKYINLFAEEEQDI